MAQQNVGSLIINLEARTAQIQQDMSQAKRIVGDAMGAIQKDSKRAADALEQTADAAGNLQRTGAAIAVGWALDSLKDQVIEVAAALNQAQIASEKLQKTLFYANGGDIKAIGADIEWLRDLSFRLGLEIDSTGVAYARFAGAVRGTGLEAYGREIFESLSLAGSAFGLSLEESEGVMRALVQMSAKGVVMAEEFRGQLADHLPVASQAAARAMGVTTGEFSRMLENGEVLADDFLPKLARELRLMSEDAAKFGGESQKASAQFNSAWSDMKKEVAASGLGSFISGQLSVMADAFNDFSASVRAARAEGSGFWGQAAAGGGAVMRFLNPVNAVKYSPQSDAARADYLKKEIANKQRTLFDWSISETLPQKRASIGAMSRELADIEKRTAKVGQDINAGKKQVSAAEAAQKSAEARAGAYVSGGKNQTKKEREANALAEEDAAFRAAVAGLNKGSKAYLDALSAHEARKAGLIESFSRKARSGGRSAQYGSTEDREVANLKSLIDNEQQLAAALAEHGVEADKLTPGQKLLNKLLQEQSVAITATAQAHIGRKIALAQDLVVLEKANLAQKEMAKSARELGDAIADSQRGDYLQAGQLRQQYETPLQRIQREGREEVGRIDGNNTLSSAEQLQMRGQAQVNTGRSIDQLQNGIRSELGAVPESEKIIQAHQEMQRRIAEVTAEGSAERVRLETAASQKLKQDTEALERQKVSTVLGMSQQVFDGMASLAETAAGRQSTAYKVMFLASKAASIAMAIVNTEEAATKALTLGPIFGVPASAMIRGLGYASVGIMAAQAVQGMAHDGIDNIPREGTWLLDKGERVVDSRTNADLKEYLKTARGGSAGGIKVVINNMAGVDVQASQSTGPNGEAQLTLDIVRRIASDTVDSKLAAAKRPGGALYG